MNTGNRANLATFATHTHHPSGSDRSFALFFCCSHTNQPRRWPFCCDMHVDIFISNQSYYLVLRVCWKYRAWLIRSVNLSCSDASILVLEERDQRHRFLQALQQYQSWLVYLTCNVSITQIPLLHIPATYNPMRINLIINWNILDGFFFLISPLFSPSMVYSMDGWFFFLAHCFIG